MDDLLKTALDEAYASAPQDKIPLDTLEINHPTFTEPMRVVRWPVLGPEPDIFYLKLEDDAPYNPGQVVKYVGFPFELTIPDSSAEAEGYFEIRVSVHQEIDRALMNAALNRGIITANYRQYIKGMELEGPAEKWVGIEIQSPRREGGDIVASGAILKWMRRPLGKIYTPGDYPGIVTGQ